MAAVAVLGDRGVDFGGYFEVDRIRQIVGDRHYHPRAPIARADRRTAGGQRDKWLRRDRKALAVGVREIGLEAARHVAGAGGAAARSAAAVARAPGRSPADLRLDRVVKPDPHMGIADQERVGALAGLLVERPIGERSLDRYAAGRHRAG